MGKIVTYLLMVQKFTNLKQKVLKFLWVQYVLKTFHFNEAVFYLFSIKTNKCTGSCNSINDPYAKLCVPDGVKDLNVKVSI